MLFSGVSLRELGPNNEVFSNADASLDQYVMEGTLIVRNPAGVALLRGITTGAFLTYYNCTTHTSALRELITIPPSTSL